jgi:hypothetical protein
VELLTGEVDGMKTIGALTLLCGLLAPLVAAAAEPRAELAGGAIATDVTVRGAKQPHYRLAAGQTLKLRLTGPAELLLEVRVEGGMPARSIVAALKLDGKVAVKTRTSAEVEPGATTDRSPGVSRAAVLAVSVPAGKHTAALRWPKGMSRDALVAIKGVQIATTQVAALLPIPPSLELPRPAGSGKATKPMPLPELDLSGNLPPPLPLPSPEAAAASKPAPAPSPEATVAQTPTQSAAPPPAPLAATAGPAKPPQSLMAQAVPARDVRGTGTPTMTGAPAREASARRPEAEPWNLTFLAGAERSSENFAEPTTLGHLGLEATREVLLTGLALVQLDWRISTQAYVLGHPSASNDVSRVDEHRVDALVGIGYDFGPLLHSTRLVLAPVIGLKYVRLQNRAFPADLFGVDLMGRLRYSLSQAVAVHASFGWMYNLVHQSFFSALGSPLGQFGIRAGLDFPLAGGYALSLDYQGDILTFDYSYRVAHGATAGFGKSF